MKESQTANETASNESRDNPPIARNLLEEKSLKITTERNACYFEVGLETASEFESHPAIGRQWRSCHHSWLLIGRQWRSCRQAQFLIGRQWRHAGDVAWWPYPFFGRFLAIFRNFLEGFFGILMQNPLRFSGIPRDFTEDSIGCLKDSFENWKEEGSPQGRITTKKKTDE